MARKPKDSNIRPDNPDGGFDPQSFVRGIYNNEYILVVGNGVILNRDKFPDAEGDINRYVLNEINEEKNKDYKNFTDVVRGTPPAEKDPVYSLLAENFDYNLEDISVELTQLLRTKLFKFVITTTIDSYLESLMRDIYGDELRVVNIVDNQSLADFISALEKSRMNEYEQPTLFYAFGKVIKGREKPKGFLETDVDAIRYIEKWMKDLDTKQIVPFLKKKRMLALGCKFDDWYFRFFWYILTRGFSDSDRDGAKDIDGSIITRDNLACMFDKNDPADTKLKDYLVRRNVSLHDDVWLFMEKIHSWLTSIDKEDNPFRSFIFEHRRHGQIFISYKSCDVLYASELFCKLTRENKLDTWFDNTKLYGGDDYNREIKDAIMKSKIFIPILSSEVSRDLSEKGEGIDTFYSDEWRWAKENKNLNILPIAIQGYNLRDKGHEIFKKIIGYETSGVDMDEKPIIFMDDVKCGFAKLLSSINKQLGLEES